ncbi:MAG: hypothetical protein C4332_10675 [Meiothermus sp.]
MFILGERMKKTAILTGGNQGLGFECVQSIAASGQSWHVVIASRGMEKARAAIAKIRAEFPGTSLEALPLDLGSLESVRRFVQIFSTRQDSPPLKAIVCNAGLQVVGAPHRTRDGFEETFGVNHLGHFLLVNLLLPHLVSPARIVVVSSGTHDPATLEGRTSKAYFESTQALAYPQKATVPLNNFRRYTTSKLCNLLFAYELNRRLQAEGLKEITVNTYDPGAVPGTGLTREYRPFMQQLWGGIAAVFKALGYHVSDPRTSGQLMARLVLDPALETASGKYFRGLAEASSSKDSYEIGKAKELWAGSAQLVGLGEKAPV